MKWRKGGGPLRSIWTGALSFGLVNIPVKVYPATDDKDISFRQLHRECHTPITYVKRCPACNRDLGQEEIVRGYEYARGQFVVLDSNDLESLPLSTTRSIEITSFVNLQEIDAIYFRHPYYLAPAEGGQKAYALLHQAMEDTGKAALAKVALRQRESLVAVRTYQKAFAMETMAYAGEIRPLAGIPELEYHQQLDHRELEMAVRLVQSLAAPFEPAMYEDNYRKALEQLISSKIEGREVFMPPSPAPAKVVDLMEALKESIQRAESQGKPARSVAAAGKRRKTGSRQVVKSPVEATAGDRNRPAPR